MHHVHAPDGTTTDSTGTMTLRGVSRGPPSTRDRGRSHGFKPLFLHSFGREHGHKPYKVT